MVIGINAFLLVLFAGPFAAPLMLYAGALGIGVGLGLFSVGTLMEAMNIAEGEAIRSAIKAAGAQGTIVFNSCAVTDEAVRQARQAARYREIGEELRRAEGMLLYRRWREADQARAEAGADADGFATTWARSHAINLQSAADLCRHAVLHFQENGGGRIINYVARTVVALLDGKHEPAAALAMAHAGNRNAATEVERGRVSEELVRELERRGHVLEVAGPWSLGRNCAVARDGDLLKGAIAHTEMLLYGDKVDGTMDDEAKALV